MDVHGARAQAVRSAVQAELDAVLARQRAVLAEVAPETEPLVDAVADLVAGGKRLRPAFCTAGYRAAGGQDGAVEARVGAALELFQAAALIHDDVMDGSDTRRGMPALHRRFGDLHATSGWSGSCERFGEAAAILAGDLCLSWSDEALAGCGAETERLASARLVFDRMRTQLMAGQYLDVLEQASGGAPEGADERAMRVLRWKSAKYTVEHPLLIGAALAGADPAQREALSAYGLPLGEAFQLRDDVLGVFGDPAVTGKPAGDDLREGKRTMLVALAAQGAGAEDADLLTSLLGAPDLDDAGVAALQDLIRRTGSLAAVEDLIDDLVARSRAALATAPVTEEAREDLERLVGIATARTA
ncbi:polyprenyl synthetase family protein [uncultured Pseudokineococcus sp.]|uniref:polyprenyl synthetase family protein n=1 Tax=uncultured Pseudokineococcus sp. TaxID=1642928 RepID=UPI002624AC1F|nr:polyprenyl synthetase family protein [uncultured Pseudokineococcus sp.]